MKRVLALLLCVLMFVSILPTSAFAWEDKAVSAAAIKEAEKSIRNMYTAIATDRLVFNSAVALHDYTNGLVERLFEDTDDYTWSNTTVYHDTLVDNARAYLKLTIGNSIAEYINDRKSVFTSNTINGGVDPVKYLNVYIAAVNNAVASEKAIKGIQAFMYDVIALRVLDSIWDRFDDLKADAADWGLDKLAEFGPDYADFTKTPPWLRPDAYTKVAWANDMEDLLKILTGVTTSGGTGGGLGLAADGPVLGLAAAPEELDNEPAPVENGSEPASAPAENNGEPASAPAENNSEPASAPAENISQPASAPAENISHPASAPVESNQSEPVNMDPIPAGPTEINGEIQP